ncbi:uncharacterized protein LOC108810494 isoform X2 [Raphanus sativus]|uniref:Uncharacterized protein LOC108810494 isoform X2 n=1 Tax=Raphanus sativus TaxID=3726 RepID=A0A6J0JTM8_RAPSA|nr:uncharacterized protein LOC108810494 isoform X2 [Raphanus sativus]
MNYDFNSLKNCDDKYRRYESEFKQFLVAKYFLNVYEERTIIYGETIMSSKWPCTCFYADSCLDQVDEEEESKDSATAEITSNVDIVTEKSC